MRARSTSTGKALLTSALCTAFACCGVPGGAPDLIRYEAEEAHLGTTVRIVVWAADSVTASDALTEAFTTVARLDSLMSDWRDDSGIAALERAAGGEPLPVEPELAGVLADAKVWWARTGGAFDPTVGPATRAWRRAMRAGIPPDSAARAALRSRVDGAALEVDVDARTAGLSAPGMSLDLGGIAKGWIADHVLAAMRERGIGSALVDAGGDLALGDAPPGADGWRVRIDEGDVRKLAGVGVATSGDRHRWLEWEGRRYSHILDPRTALGVVDAPTVTVIAPDATTADVLASALTILTGDDRERLLDSLGGVEARIIPADPNLPPQS